MRVRLADRSLRQTNPVLAAVTDLLALASSRVTASQVLDLAAAAPIRRRFGFDDDDLARITEWVGAAGIRWGLDGAHRAAWLLDGVDAGTWRTGIRRILLGVAMSEDGQRTVNGVLPLDDVDSGDVELAGRFVEFVDRLAAALDGLANEQPVTGWIGAIRAAAETLLATSGPDEWQRAQLYGLLDDVTTEATASAETDLEPRQVRPAVNLGVAEVRDLLADRLRGRPTRANFRTGHLTMCTLVPMRSVPHRVVCLLGLDDGVFPRRTVPDGDDLIDRAPWVGDRDARSEDRQLLLDALLAAGGHLVITYTGHDERTNAARPPAVPVGELLDVVDRTVASCDAASGEACAARRQVVTEHPLQPYDPRNFTTGELVPGQAWSFDDIALEGARASTGPRHPAPALLDEPLAPVVDDTVEIDDLVSFVQHPAKAFLRQRLGVVLRGADDDPGDALPIDPDGLGLWAIGSRLLELRLAGLDEATCKAAEVARGSLPPGVLGERILEKVAPKVERLVATARTETGEGPAEAIDVKLDLGGGRTLAGTVGGVVAGAFGGAGEGEVGDAGLPGAVVRAVTYSRLAAKHRLAAWVRVLALSAAFPERRWRAVTVGRGNGLRAEVSTMTLPVPADGGHALRRAAALAHLGLLVDLYYQNMAAPLPLYCATSGAYAAARHAGAGPSEAAKSAENAWVTTSRFSGEDQDRYHRLVLGARSSFCDVLEAPGPGGGRRSGEAGVCPGNREAGVGHGSGEPSYFGVMARLLWDGLLAHEVVST